MIKKIKHDQERSEFLSLLNKLVPGGRGVEIGVFKGQFSKEILDIWDGKLYMVDVWRGLGEEYQDMSNHNNHSEAYLNTMQSIIGLEERAIMIRSASSDCIDLFENESLDFIYIDANHAYDFVKEDIDLWFPKLKKGGIFSGHDYVNLDWDQPPYLENGKDKHIYTNTFSGEVIYNGIFGVNPAVDEFCKNNNYELNLTNEWFGTWWTIK
jgi:hypothetical protein